MGCDGAGCHARSLLGERRPLGCRQQGQLLRVSGRGRYAHGALGKGQLLGLLVCHQLLRVMERVDVRAACWLAGEWLLPAPAFV